MKKTLEEVEDTVSALLDYGGYTGYLYMTTAQWPGTMRVVSER